MPRDADALRTIDLRPRGAPVATYAAKVQRLIVNGQEVTLDRPVLQPGQSAGLAAPLLATPGLPASAVGSPGF